MLLDIWLFCAATGLATRPRAVTHNDFIQSVMKLNESHCSVLNRPVGCPKKSS